MDGKLESYFKLSIGDDIFYVFVDFPFASGMNFSIAVTDGENVWTGRVTEADLRKQHKKLQISWDDFTNKTKQALHCVEQTSGTYECQLVRKGQLLDFSWKRYLLSEDIKFQLGTLRLERAAKSASSFTAILDRCLEMTIKLRDDIQSIGAEKQQMSSEKNTALKRWEKMVEWKETLEGDLYSKFVSVLNEKKKKIEELEAEITAYENEAKLTPQGSGSSSVKRTHESTSLSASATDTDEEVSEAKLSRKASRSSTAPRVTKDESLLLGDAEDDLSSAQTTARRVRSSRGKKKTPSKPIIPKVPSNASRQRSSGVGSMGRSASHVSRSSDNIDAEDLLGDL